MKKTAQTLVSILFFLLLLVLGYFLGLHAQWENFLSHREKTIQLEKALSETHIKIRDTAKFHAMLLETKNNFNQLKSTLPPLNQFPDYLRTISQLAETEGLKVLSITPQTIEPQDFQHHDFYDSITLELSIQGSYQQLIQFLQKLNQQHYFVTLSHFTLMRQSEAFNLNLNPENRPDLLFINATAEFYCLA